jgi:hypothetical protein
MNVIFNEYWLLFLVINQYLTGFQNLLGLTKRWFWSTKSDWNKHFRKILFDFVKYIQLNISKVRIFSENLSTLLKKIVVLFGQFVKM